jgi:hypothetical protein
MHWSSLRGTPSWSQGALLLGARWWDDSSVRPGVSGGVTWAPLEAEPPTGEPCDRSVGRLILPVIFLEVPSASRRAGSRRTRDGRGDLRPWDPRPRVAVKCPFEVTRRNHAFESHVEDCHVALAELRCRILIFASGAVRLRVGSFGSDAAQRHVPRSTNN